MKGILGKKVGMTQVFTKDGKLIPVTVVEIPENVVYQIKTLEKDGYSSVQLGAFDKKKSRIIKPEEGKAKKIKTSPKRFLKEFKDFEGEYKVGDKITSSIFSVGEIVDVSGVSKGKGFQGVIKRHGFSIGPMSHGSHFHRKPGSLGSIRAKRVFKGTKLPGHMGSETITIQNLEIIEINEEKNYVLISGSIPGPKGSLVIIKEAVKNNVKASPKELLKYDEVAEVKTNVTEEAQVEAPKEEGLENSDKSAATQKTDAEDKQETKQINQDEKKEEPKETTIEVKTETEEETEKVEG